MFYLSSFFIICPLGNLFLKTFFNISWLWLIISCGLSLLPLVCLVQCHFGFFLINKCKGNETVWLVPGLFVFYKSMLKSGGPSMKISRKEKRKKKLVHTYPFMVHILILHILLRRDRDFCKS